MAGLGKRVPVTLLRLQNRAGLGVRVIKFRKKNDKLAALHVVNPHEEFMIITERGIIIRQSVMLLLPNRDRPEASGTKTR